MTTGQQINHKTQTISAEFPFESKYEKVKGSNIHYIDEGQGDVILFLHGNPTSNYLWRNIIPYVSKNARCIAPDLIGMGKSSKPDIDYGFKDSYAYLASFIEQLGLKNVTLVLHDWGSGLGFHYASQHPENVKGICFMEAVYKHIDFAAKPKSVQQTLKLTRQPFINWFMFGVLNMFVKKMIPDMINRKLTKEEFDYYKAPFKTTKSRKPVRVWPAEIAINGKPRYVHDVISNFHEFLTETTIPKLCLYVSPGMLIMEDEIPWIKNNMKNLKAVHVGEGLHFIQEDCPHEIGEALADWYKTLN